MKASALAEVRFWPRTANCQVRVYGGWRHPDYCPVLVYAELALAQEKVDQIVAACHFRVWPIASVGAVQRYVWSWA